jgi:hypothetical protein
MIRILLEGCLQEERREIGVRLDVAHGHHLVLDGVLHHINAPETSLPLGALLRSQNENGLLHQIEDAMIDHGRLHVGPILHHVRMVEETINLGLELRLDATSARPRSLMIIGGGNLHHLVFLAQVLPQLLGVPRHQSIPKEQV